MLEAFKKGVKVGIGLTVISKEKLEKVAFEVAKRGEITKKEAKKVSSQLMKQINAEKKKLDNLIDKETKKKLKDLGYVSKAEALKFIEKIKKLEALLEQKAKGKGTNVTKKIKKKTSSIKKRVASGAKRGLNKGIRSAAGALKK